MIYFKKAFFLCHKVLRKIALLVRNRFDLIEVRILFTGVTLAILTFLYLFSLLFTDFGLHKTLSSAAMVHLIGGRAMGIAVCLSSGISTFYTIFYNFFLEVVIVLVAYGIIVLVMRNIIQPKLFRAQVRQAEFAAQDQKNNIKKYGAIGLFFFVMLPFFMTGPVVGSIIGYLLNYRAVNNFIIVFSGTLSSIVIYTLVGNQTIAYINQYVQFDTVKKWVTIIVGTVIVLVLIYHLKTVKSYLDSETAEK
ncbi:MAG: small multi-drug export protein [Deltaproteobacteria bacterium]|nr:small multi-drug export protein [Deltaproteobacteria bacterium]